MSACVCVDLKMSCVSISMWSPLMKRAESPGCRPRVPLKNCGDMNVDMNKYPAHSHTQTFNTLWSILMEYCQERDESRWQKSWIFQTGGDSEVCLKSLYVEQIKQHNKSLIIRERLWKCVLLFMALRSGTCVYLCVSAVTKKKICHVADKSHYRKTNTSD